MGLKKLIVLIASLTAITAMAGVKEDFIEAVVKSCGKSKDEAEKMATPGRSGNVIKWQTCSASSVDVDGCSVACASSSKIGN